MASPQATTCPSYTSTCAVTLFQPPLAARTSASNFGVSVSVGSNYAVIGASGTNRAFVFQIRPLLTEAIATLQASDAVLGDGFGKAVSISKSGNWIIVGAPYRTEGGATTKGAVYVYRISSGQWLYHSKITSNVAVSGDRFGWSVSIDDSLGRIVALVGCYYRTDVSGFVEVFEMPSAGGW